MLRIPGKFGEMQSGYPRKAFSYWVISEKRNDDPEDGKRGQKGNVAAKTRMRV